jgi:hypothetical protein
VSEARAHAELLFGRTHDLREPERRVPRCRRAGKISSGSERPGGVARGRVWAWSLVTEGGISGSHRSAAAQTRVERRRVPRALACKGDIRGRPRGINATARMVRQTHPHLSVGCESPPKCTDPACAFRFVTAAPPLTRFERGHCSVGVWRQPASACAANSSNVVANAFRLGRRKQDRWRAALDEDAHDWDDVRCRA